MHRGEGRSGGAGGRKRGEGGGGKIEAVREVSNK